MMLCLYDKKGAFGFFFFFVVLQVCHYCFTLKHFFVTSQEKSTQSDQICRDIRRVFLRERRAQQWTAGLVFWYLSLSLKGRC